MEIRVDVFAPRPLQPAIHTASLGTFVTVNYDCGKDLVREVAEALREEGLGLGEGSQLSVAAARQDDVVVYHSTLSAEPCYFSKKYNEAFPIPGLPDIAAWSRLMADQPIPY